MPFCSKKTTKAENVSTSKNEEASIDDAGEVQSSSKDVSANSNKSPQPASTEDKASAALAKQNAVVNKRIQELKMKMEMLKLSNVPKSEEEAIKKKYDFWDTQPVPKFSETIETNESIEPDKPIEQIPKEGLNLPAGFMWVSLDLDNAEHLHELYTLLYENYVEDDDNMFRFNYSPEFLRWVMRAPGWKPEWYVGLRVQPKNPNSLGKLVGFISAIPTKIRVFDKYDRCALFLSST